MGESGSGEGEEQLFELLGGGAVRISGVRQAVLKCSCNNDETRAIEGMGDRGELSDNVTARRFGFHRGDDRIELTARAAQTIQYLALSGLIVNGHEVGPFG